MSYRTKNIHESITSSPYLVGKACPTPLFRTSPRLSLTVEKTCGCGDGEVGEHVAGVGLVVIEREREPPDAQVKSDVSVKLALPWLSVGHIGDVGTGKSAIKHTRMVAVGSYGSIGEEVLISGKTHRSTKLELLKGLVSHPRFVVDIPPRLSDQALLHRLRQLIERRRLRLKVPSKRYLLS